MYKILNVLNKFVTNGKPLISAFSEDQLMHTGHVCCAIDIPSPAHRDFTSTPAHVSKLLSAACKIIGGKLK